MVCANCIGMFLKGRFNGHIGAPDVYRDNIGALNYGMHIQ